MKNTTYSTFNVLKIFQIPRGKLKAWMELGFIKPSILAKGRGTRAVFTIVDVYAIGLFRELLSFGFRRTEAAKLVESSLSVFKNEDIKIASIAFGIFKIKNKEKFNVAILPIVDGNNSLKINLFTGKPETVVNKKNGTIEIIKHNWGKPEWEAEEFDHMFVVNFKKLQQRVDDAVKSL